MQIHSIYGLRNSVASFFRQGETPQKKKRNLACQKRGEKQTDHKHFRFWYFPCLSFFHPFLSTFLFLSLVRSDIWLRRRRPKKTANKNAAACSSSSSSSFRINDKLFETQKLKFVEGENNLFNVSVSGSIPKEELESPTTIECFLTVPETNYTKKRSTIYYGKSAPKPPRSTTQPTQPFQTSPERKPNAKLVIVNEFFSSSCCAFVVLLAFFSTSLVFHGKLIVCMCGCAFSYFI